MNGIINLHKESGKSSAFFVDRVKKILSIKAIGHFGTLDPQGTGVLVLGVGKATKLFDYYLKKDKVYEADFAFGFETDTLDGDGTVVKTCEKIPTRNELERASKKFLGLTTQMPPQFSAKKIDGKRAYDLARKGEKVKLKTNKVEIKEFSLLEQRSSPLLSPAIFSFRICCTSGTYIRSLCRDLAEAVGSLATMTSIHRSRSGDFLDSDSLTLSQIEKLGLNAITPLEKVFEGLERYTVESEFEQKLLNGVKIKAPDIDGIFAVYVRKQFFALAKKDEHGNLSIVTRLL